MTDALSELTRLAQAHRVARIGYRRPGESEAGATEYLVEPYWVQRPASPASGPAELHAWQLSPPPEGRSAWRDFRADRITAVADTGQSFESRIPLALGQRSAGAAAGAPTGEIVAPGAPPPAGASPFAHFAEWGERPIEPLSPADEYFRQIESAMLDAQITPDEFALAEELGRRVPADQRKAVHARVYASVLREVARDGRIAHREELYLTQVRQLLTRLGWVP